MSVRIVTAPGGSAFARTARARDPSGRARHRAERPSTTGARPERAARAARLRRFAVRGALALALIAAAALVGALLGERSRAHAFVTLPSVDVAAPSHGTRVA